MSSENEEVTTPAEETPVEITQPGSTPVEVNPEDAKPVGDATIVEMETPIDNFPAAEENA